MENENLPSIQVEFFHVGQYAVSEEPLGICSVQLDSIQIPSEADNPSYIELKPHLDATGRMKQATGMVILIKLFYFL